MQFLCLTSFSMVIDTCAKTCCAQKTQCMRMLNEQKNSKVTG